jgi:hypothetical protein
MADQYLLLKLVEPFPDAPLTIEVYESHFEKPISRNRIRDLLEWLDKKDINYSKVPVDIEHLIDELRWLTREENPEE